ncbi:dimethylsulfoxide reductase [Superficieibacter electus]|uniref:Dimethylsulfoxide reductase n=1 Tax=Superficieibacter electus TaxID=2022662 RepID=A0A2P5GTW1_9ENTR|nr:dimethyl sulfoxide reductase anchor subunit family protein [Superficieibacter electus]POP47142.1 dimethylsulfoxide reductase [Superficieibacter electus]POP49988.1 dimethylsulfoxide reductase [Superficieibacter electus]
MGNGWHEWPLVLFTVLGQCVVGGLIVTGLGWMAASDDRASQQRLVRSMFFLWLVMGIAFLASVMHLGSPLRAFNSLNRVGSSALSNEIASGSLFFAVGGFWWLVAVTGKMPALLGKVWLIVSMILGVIFIWAMTRVYLINTVPTWYTGYTTISFFLTALLAGPIFGALLLRAARIPFKGSAFATLSIVALLVSVVIMLLQGVQIGTVHSSVQQASALVPDYAAVQIGRLILLVLGLGCWLCPLVRRHSPHTLSILCGCVLVIAGELLGRIVFYGLHMTVGMAVAG